MQGLQHSNNFQVHQPLRTALVRVKDPIPMEKSGVVYEVPCSCGKVYIGETKRTLETRMKEHRAAASWRSQQLQNMPGRMDIQ